MSISAAEFRAKTGLEPKRQGPLVAVARLLGPDAAVERRRLPIAPVPRAHQIEELLADCHPSLVRLVQVRVEAVAGLGLEV